MKRIALIIMVVLLFTLTGCNKETETVVSCSVDTMQDIVKDLIDKNEYEYKTDTCEIRIVQDRITFTEFDEEGSVYNTDWYSIKKIIK